MPPIVGIVTASAAAIQCEDIFSCTVMGGFSLYMISQWFNELFTS